MPHNSLVFPFEPVGSLSLLTFANTVFLIKQIKDYFPYNLCTVPGTVPTGLWSKELSFSHRLKTWENNSEKSSRTYRSQFNKQWQEAIKNRIGTTVGTGLDQFGRHVKVVPDHSQHPSAPHLFHSCLSHHHLSFGFCESLLTGYSASPRPPTTVCFQLSNPLIL